MSHRKFEHPRHGSLGFLPRKRCKKHKGRIRTHPRDDRSKAPHLTSFIGYKAGMTHILREVTRVGSKLHNKDAVEAVTIVETPPMALVGIVGQVETPRGLKKLGVAWAAHLSEEFKRRLQKSWNKNKPRKAFNKQTEKLKKSPQMVEKKLNQFKKMCVVVRAILHSRMKRVAQGQKKAHVMEVQINGGTVPEKVDFAQNLLEKEVYVKGVFEEGECIDTISITKGKGFEGVTARWGTSRLPRKTHKGLRKVACIGAWHPARVAQYVPRAGQHGQHHRCEHNKRIYKLGTAISQNGGEVGNCTTEYDLTNKNVTPMGGFRRQGCVNEDFLLLKGSIPGPVKRCVTLRKSVRPVTARKFHEPINLKFIDTSSKTGNGRFQTSEEKNKFFGWTAAKAKVENK